MNSEIEYTGETKSASRRMARKYAFEICFESCFHRFTTPAEFVQHRIDNPIECDESAPEGNIVAVFKGENLKFIKEIAVLTISNTSKLDEILMKYPWEWSYERIGLPEKVILRMALAELVLMDTPIKIVINEALDLAKAYGERDANKFVNGILGSIVQDIEKIKRETAFICE